MTADIDTSTVWAWTGWSRFGLSLQADDVPLVADGAGGYRWAKGTWNVSQIARFDSEEEATAAIGNRPGHRGGKLCGGATRYPFYAYELAP